MRHVEITYLDFNQVLHLSTIDEIVHSIAFLEDYNLIPMNTTLRESSVNYNIHHVNNLVLDTQIIHHILQYSVFSKAGDKENITPLLSFTTYFIMFEIDIHVTNVVI